MTEELTRKRHPITDNGESACSMERMARKQNGTGMTRKRGKNTQQGRKSIATTEGMMEHSRDDSKYFETQEHTGTAVAKDGARAIRYKD
ncbi:hypothetical protein K435DRAFT_25552 [Dendrothele bispora CBS 962.96]|uniref:Uncharacterized protein n=1 Tax=Dendrothele bispora (strain CBS 962.96) TaxID=1314807 RepID=A0A4S8MSX4_DENBC|nr:hypothetical protein K435DRAFT_55776 [Dendrothele bispora CBS 962.96]THV06268.1 hypothetical protein K435DRAFT_25552 [Dendrothele bispora CBS 962.96]